MDVRNRRPIYHPGITEGSNSNLPVFVAAGTRGIVTIVHANSTVVRVQFPAGSALQAETGSTGPYEFDIPQSDLVSGESIVTAQA